MKTFSKLILMKLVTKTNGVHNFFNYLKEYFEIFMENVWLKNVMPPLRELSITRNVRNVLNDNFTYISPELQGKINLERFRNYRLFYEFEGIPIKLDIYTQSFNQKDYEKLMLVIHFCIYYCIHVRNQSCNLLTIKLILAPYDKLMHRRKKWRMDKTNVNGGVTIKNYTDNTCKIVIFRKEELFKVLIHEILHSFDLDSKTVSNTEEQKINEFINIRKIETDEFESINVNESFTDTYACLLNVFLATMLLSYKTKGDKTHVFNKLLKLEQKHIISQARKVIKNLNIPMEKQVLRRNDKIYREKTHIMSYYVLKGINFVHIDDFIELLSKNNYMLLNHNEYIDFLFARLHSTKLKTKYDQKIIIANNTFTKFYLKCLENSKKHSSLRMSSVDILDI
jgi:hypothetical protein